jgi:hypothetical protein
MGILFYVRQLGKTKKKESFEQRYEGNEEISHEYLEEMCISRKGKGYCIGPMTTTC